jgi:hypothetical protein
MPSTVKLPLVGQVSKGKAAGIAVGGIGVTAILWYRHMTKASASATAIPNAGDTYGYGSGDAYAYGAYSPYGYGSYGDSGGFQQYPFEQAYGYGAYGYGIYDPATGQYFGGSVPGVGTTPVAPISQAGWIAAVNQALGASVALDAALGKYLTGIALSTSEYQLVTEAIGVAGPAPGSPPAPHLVKAPGQTSSPLHTITASGSQNITQIANTNHISRAQIVLLNPKLAHYLNSKKNLPKGTKVLV